jgi:glycosyltransferase involved in cell wall biosynthesis
MCFLFGACFLRLLFRFPSYRLADMVVSSSQWYIEWLRSMGYVLPRISLSIQNPLYPYDKALQKDSAILPRSLVFFGRLEVLKGILVFLEALDLLYGNPVSIHPKDIYFVGVSVAIGKTTSKDLIDQSCRKFPGTKCTIKYVPFPAEGRGVCSFGMKKKWISYSTVTLMPTFLMNRDDMGPKDAISFILKQNALVLLPTLGETSSYTVQECIYHGLPFLASEVGGVPELIAEESKASVLLPPGDADALAGTFRFLARWPPQRLRGPWLSVTVCLSVWPLIDVSIGLGPCV